MKPDWTDFVDVWDEIAIEALAAELNGKAALTGPQTITATRINPRVVAVTNVTSWTIDADVTDVAINTGLTGNVTVNAPTGTKVNGQRLRVSMTGTGSRTITWNNGVNGFTGSNAYPVPASTPGAGRVDVDFIWDIVQSKWRTANDMPYPVSGGNFANYIALRDANSNILADAFVNEAQAVATAAGTLTMNINSMQTIIFTGTNIHTCVLPTTSITYGYWYRIINQSTGAVTVNASGGTLVAVLAAGQTLLVESIAFTPTTNAHWAIIGGTWMPPAPASATAAGFTGQIAQDGSYFYVCTATNTWKRAALSTW